MNRIKLEGIKTFILIILIFASLIQVGILWGYHGFPINFIMAVLGDKPTNSPNDNAREDLFKPERIIVSAGGVGGRRWVIDVETQKERYNKLLQDAQLYISDIFDKSKSSLVTSEIERSSEENWEDIITKKAVIYEFSTSMDKNILKWLLEVEELSPLSPSGIRKMAVSWEDMGTFLNIYIMDGRGAIYTYGVQVNKIVSVKRDYNSIIEQLNSDETLNYKLLFKSLRLQKNYIKQDVLFSAGSPGLLNEVIQTKSDFLIHNPPTESGLDEIGSYILGDERKSFKGSYDIESRTILFKTLNFSYSIYENGVLDYRYLSKLNNSDKGSIEVAFRNAMDFIMLRKAGLMQGVDYYLTGIYEDKYHDSYEFTFDYTFKGKPILINYKVNEKLSLSHAITIRANRNNVINCQWILNEFDVSNIEPKSYDVDFADLINRVYDANESMIEKEQFVISDIDTGYVATEMDSARDAVRYISPSWIISIEKDTKEKQGYWTIPVTLKD